MLNCMLLILSLNIRQSHNMISNVLFLPPHHLFAIWMCLFWFRFFLLFCLCIIWVPVAAECTGYLLDSFFVLVLCYSEFLLFSIDRWLHLFMSLLCGWNCNSDIILCQLACGRHIFQLICCLFSVKHQEEFAHYLLFLLQIWCSVFSNTRILWVYPV